MAHADYDCCAVCDCKMNYNEWEAETKGRICGECVADMARLGVICGTAEELIEWINAAEPSEVKRILGAVGYDPCHYDNPVDQAVRARTAAPHDSNLTPDISPEDTRP